jgi:hypothetical protein
MAITSVPYKPQWISPAYNPIVWSVLSTKVNSTDFKYVFDIYEVGNATPIQRIKQRANPTGYGMIDISTLVQGYIDSSNVNSAMTQGELTIEYTANKVFADNNLMSKKYFVKVGEEYTLNGVTQIYNGVTDTAGAPNFLLYSGNTQMGNTTTPVTVFCATLTDMEQQWQMKNTTASGVFGNFNNTVRSGNPFNGNTIYDKNYGLAHPLNFAELEQDVYAFDNTVLSYINWSPLTNNTTDQYVIFGFRFKRLNAAGTVIDTVDRPMTLQYGFAQKTNCSDIIMTTLDAKYALVHVLASPDKLATALGWSAIQPGQTISIQGFSQLNPSGGDCTFGAAVTAESKFHIQEYCVPLYPRVRLSWFNTLGGRDYMNFTMFTEKSINTSQSNYSQEQLNYSGATPVPSGQPYASPYGNTSVKGGNKPYAKQSETMYSIQTDWLLQDQVDVLEGLVKSPQVLAYIKDANNLLADDIPYNCIITNTNYTTKNVRQTKMVQGTFTVKLTIPQSIQTL